VKRRSSIVAALLVAALAVPSPARAADEPASTWVAPAYRPELLPPAFFAEAREEASARVAFRATDPTLSRGAKIAIIVCAIVVGVIIIFGVASLHPH
jgi:hypothetical protein